MAPESSPSRPATSPIAPAVVAGVAAGYALGTRRRRLRSAALCGPLSIRWDALGVPTIVAGCRDDALFGLGYVVARDRPLQLDLLRRAALGRLAEVIGPEGLPNDRLMRLVGMPRIADEAAAVLTADERAATAAFAAGVNLRMSSVATPPEFRALRYRPEPWRIADSTAIGRLIGWIMGAGVYVDLLAEQVRAALGDAWFEAIYGAGPAPSVPPPAADHARDTTRAATDAFAPPLVGSNAWAVAGERSATGRPLLANDPHLAFNNPSLWYEAALDAPGFHVAGVTIPGAPLIGIGRTPTFAWGFTVSMVHQTLLYRERLNAAGDAVADGAGWAPLRMRVETIGVRGRDAEQLVARSTPRGPLLSDIVPDWTAQPVSLHWVGAEPSHDIAGFLRINAARGVDDALAARELMASPPFVMAAADAAGDIASISLGRFPIREDRPGLLDPASFPPRYVPVGEMPLERNPARGWIASANGRLVGRDYPYPLKGAWEPRFRGGRIARELDARPRHTPADMRALQLDRYSPHAAVMTPALLALLGDAAPEWALGELRAWDFVATPESRATALFQAFYHHWVLRALELRLPAELALRFTANTGAETQFALYDRLLLGELDSWFDGTAGREALARACFAEGLAWLAERLGTEPANWTWGAAHTLTLTHPFGMRPGPHARYVNVGPFPLGGDRTTLWLSWWSMQRPFAALGGPSLRFVADLRDGRRNWLTNTLGQSERPFSRHYRDQTPDYLNGRWHPFPRPGRGRRLVIEPARPAARLQR